MVTSHQKIKYCAFVFANKKLIIKVLQRYDVHEKIGSTKTFFVMLYFKAKQYNMFLRKDEQNKASTL